MAAGSIGARTRVTGEASHHHAAAMRPMETKNNDSGVRKAIVLSYGKHVD